MKKILQSVVVRALTYLAMGLLFIVYSHQVSNWLVVVSGAFFVLTGTIVLLNHWWKRKERPSILYPVVALGAICFGAVLILFSPSSSPPSAPAWRSSSSAWASCSSTPSGA